MTDDTITHEAPERIWAQYSTLTDCMAGCTHRGPTKDENGYADCPHEYVRADLARAPLTGPEVAAIRAEERWQPIETAPRDGTRFLAFERMQKADRIYECWWQKDFSNWDGWQDDWDSEPEPTHWMPKPPLPAAIRALTDKETDHE